MSDYKFIKQTQYFYKCAGTPLFRLYVQLSEKDIRFIAEPYKGEFDRVIWKVPLTTTSSSIRKLLSMSDENKTCKDIRHCNDGDCTDCDTIILKFNPLFKSLLFDIFNSSVFAYSENNAVRDAIRNNPLAHAILRKEEFERSREVLVNSFPIATEQEGHQFLFYKLKECLTLVCNKTINFKVIIKSTFEAFKSAIRKSKNAKGKSINVHFNKSFEDLYNKTYSWFDNVKFEMKYIFYDKNCLKQSAILILLHQNTEDEEINYLVNKLNRLTLLAENTIQVSDLSLWKKYGETEAEWVNVCLDKSNEYLFNNTYSWFDDVEFEMKSIFFVSSYPKQTNVSLYSWLRFTVQRVKCFQRYISEKNNIATEKNIPNKTIVKRIWYCMLHITIDHNLHLISQTNLKGTEWFLKRYDLTAAACLFIQKFMISTLGKERTINFIYIIILVWDWCILTLAFLISIIIYVFFLSHVYKTTLILTIILLLFSLFKKQKTKGMLSIFVNIFTSNNSRNRLTHVHIAKRIIFLLYGVLAFVLSAIASNIFNFKHLGIATIFGIIVCGVFIPVIVIILSCILAYQKQHFNKEAGLRSEQTLFIMTRMALPRLFFAIVTAWFIFVLPSDFWSIIIVPKMLIGSFLLVLIAYLFTAMKINKYIHNTIDAMSRSSYILLVALLMSVVVGALFSGVVGERMLRRSELFHTEPDIPISCQYVEQLSVSMQVCDAESNNNIADFIEEYYICNNEKAQASIKNDLKELKNMNAYSMTNDLSNGVNYNFSKQYCPFQTGQTELTIEHHVNLLKHLVCFKKTINWHYATNYYGSIISTGKTPDEPQDKWNLRYLYTVKIFGCSFYIIPLFILHYSFIAVFIALFLQLIFEDKQITEPL